VSNVLAYVAELAAISGLTGAEVLADRRYDPVVQELAREEPASPDESGGPGGLAGRVAELMQAIEQGTRSPSPSNLDLLAAYERLDRLGRPFNAVASVIGAPDRAEDGPGAGRPVAVKDIIAVAGVPTRCGSPSTDPDPALFDAALVQRLRAAGYEVFATTQCLEYAAGFAHPEIGDTRNPRDSSRTSGGSSGGSAAVVAAGVCDLAVGTDTGGSVRIPAAYCGVVGLKPSYGRVPVDGVFPLSPSCDHVGTLTSTVGGAAELLAAMTSPDAPGEDSTPPGAPFEAPVSSAPPAQPEPSPTPVPSDPDVPAAAAPAFTVGLLAGQLTDPSVTAEVHEAIGAALGRLTDAGWEIRDLAAPWLDRLPDWEGALAVIVAYEACLVHADRDTSRYAEGTRALLAYGASLSDEQYAQALHQRTELADAIEASLAGVDVLAGPTVGYQAPEQDPPFGVGDDNGEGRFTGPYNLSGHPAVSLPVRVPGLPVGLQFAGRRDRDEALLRVAAAAESLISPNEGRPGV
jgi:aspartyl-tRNA(Asn)/glutamyl-tRNA(Gln) amidotransferase subunit A